MLDYGTLSVLQQSLHTQGKQSGLKSWAVFGERDDGAMCTKCGDGKQDERKPKSTVDKVCTFKGEAQEKRTTLGREEALGSLRGPS